ncbi:MAG: hydrogenase maturation protease [Promethearchaeota archaeon]
MPELGDRVDFDVGATPDLRGSLEVLLAGGRRVIVIGVGEPKMRDDGVGPFVIVRLYELVLFGGEPAPDRMAFIKRAGGGGYREFERLLLLNPNTTPENWLGEMVEFRPDVVLIVDSAQLGAPPGTVELVPAEKIVNVVGISTHTLPIPILVDRLKSEVPGVDVYLVGVEPEVIDGNRQVNYYVDGKRPDFLDFLDTVEANEDLPFFDFDLTDTIGSVGASLARVLYEVFIDLGYISPALPPNSR